MKSLHHTQVKLAAKLNVEIVVGEDAYTLVRDGETVEAPEGVELVDGEDAEVEADEADEAGDDADEDDGSRSIVKPKYKAIYAETSIPGTCGDDFAAAFKAFVTDEETGELDVDKLKQVARANKIDVNTVKFGTTARGWQGRMRMVIGNMLRGRVRKGFAVTIGSQVFEPAEEEGEAAGE